MHHGMRQNFPINLPGHRHHLLKAERVPPFHQLRLFPPHPQQFLGKFRVLQQNYPAVRSVPVLGDDQVGFCIGGAWRAMKGGGGRRCCLRSCSAHKTQVRLDDRTLTFIMAARKAIDDTGLTCWGRDVVGLCTRCRAVYALYNLVTEERLDMYYLNEDAHGQMGTFGAAAAQIACSRASGVLEEHALPEDRSSS